jgi:transposase
MKPRYGCAKSDNTISIFVDGLPVRTSGKSQAQIERELGISSGCLSRWRKKFAAEGEQAFPGNECTKPAEEHLQRIERENEILRQERDILKKAVAIFSQPSR